MTSILNAPYTTDILGVSEIILIISHCTEGGTIQSLGHRFLVCFTIMIWSFGVAAAQHDAPPQNHNIKAAENATICAAFAKMMGLQTSLHPKAAKQWHGRQHHATNPMRDIAIQKTGKLIGQTCTKIFYHADLSSLKQAPAKPNTDKDASTPTPKRRAMTRRS